MSIATTNGLPEGNATTLSRGSRACIDSIHSSGCASSACAPRKLIYPTRGCEPANLSAAQRGQASPAQGLAAGSSDAHPAAMPTRTQSDLPVLHLVNRFNIGGAERQFIERLRCHPEGFAPVLGWLELSGPMGEQARALGHLAG